MLKWAIRGLLAAGVVVLLVVALGTPRPSAEPAPTLTVAPTTPPATATAGPVSPTLQPTARAQDERVVSRVTRATLAPYPTSTPRPANQPFVNVVDFGYLPEVIRIRVGQTVTWQNGGKELHDVTGIDGWYSGPIADMAEYRHTFGFPGSFGYRCTVYPDMRGTVVVEN
jgi:plastocyanin